MMQNIKVKILYEVDYLFFLFDFRIFYSACVSHVHFNKALATDPKCVDALVARGALSANQGHYKRAMQDFEGALQIDHKHINASKYLHDVLNNIANE